MVDLEHDEITEEQLAEARAAFEAAAKSEKAAEELAKHTEIVRKLDERWKAQEAKHKAKLKEATALRHQAAAAVGAAGRARQQLVDLFVPRELVLIHEREMHAGRVIQATIRDARARAASWDLERTRAKASDMTREDRAKRLEEIERAQTAAERVAVEAEADLRRQQRKIDRAEAEISAALEAGYRLAFPQEGEVKGDA